MLLGCRDQHEEEPLAVSLFAMAEEKGGRQSVSDHPTKLMASNLRVQRPFLLGYL